jgi:hypothetical protein
VDPDGREVRPVGDQALQQIRDTVPMELRGAVVVGKNGMLDKAALNAVETSDQNFLDLRTAANLTGVMEVRMAKGAVIEGVFQPFVYESTASLRAFASSVGVLAADLPTKGRNFSGQTESTSNGVFVILADHDGATATMPRVERAATAAHEMYGHGLPKMLGRPWTHEYGRTPGPVDAATIQIERRTRALYGIR